VKVRELGWQEDDIILVGGGYSSSLLSWKSYRRFRSKAHPEYGEILIEVRKATPFSRWELSEYKHDMK
jgi:hypothetical protein